MLSYPLQITLCTSLIGDLEQLEDPARPMTPGAEDDPDAGDAALYRQLFTDLLQSQHQNQMILSLESLLIVDQLFTDQMQNQQQKEMSLIQETLLLIEELFTDLLQKEQKQEMILMQEMLLLTEKLFTDLLQKKEIILMQETLLP